MKTRLPKFIALCTYHPVAANVLMLLFIISGLWALKNLNTQFFPDFNVEVISVKTQWIGANAKDVSESITRPLEQELRSINYLKELTSTSSENLSSINVEFMPGTDMGQALNEVKDKINLVSNLPDGIEQPEISRVIFYEDVAQIIISSNNDITQLRSLVHTYERELLNAGISKVDISGLPDEEIHIEVSKKNLYNLKKSLPEIGRIINKQNQNIPSGKLQEPSTVQQIRASNQKKLSHEIANLPIITDDKASMLRVGDIGTISEQQERDSHLIFYKGKPAVILSLLRTKESDSLQAAKIFQTWLKNTQKNTPNNIQIVAFSENWKLLKERINLLIKNGASGLVLLVVILFLLLNRHIAFYVAAGIPVAFLATLSILYFAGGSINMISLFALIMALGIIVDDAIVVGEEALTKYEQGMSPLKAILAATATMLPAVSAASLTTIAAFSPLMLISGVMGKFLFELPFVVICVIIASLLESFLILPGHLYHSFKHFSKKELKSTASVRYKLDSAFDNFKNNKFKPFVDLAVTNSKITLVIIFAITFITLNLVFTNIIKFNFFPDPEITRINANVRFISGTPIGEINDFMGELKTSLEKTEAQLGGNLIVNAIFHKNTAFFIEKSPFAGSNVASIWLEMKSPEQRTITNNQFIKKWRQNIKMPSGIETLNIAPLKAGPPGGDVDIVLYNQPNEILKQASLDLIKHLNTYKGVLNTQDDLPYGQLENIFTLRPLAHRLGITYQDVSEQLKAAFDGYTVQIFNREFNEVEVKVILPKAQRQSLATLINFPITTKNGNAVPLSNLVTWKTERGLDIVIHDSGIESISISADVDSSQNNANIIISDVVNKFLPKLIEKYNIKYKFKGRNKDQAQTLSDMAYGAILAIALIYLILTWVFASFTWPFLVLVTIPFGIIGAILGHFILGIDLTILSLFGFFGLAGIVINDSIILILHYKSIRKSFDSNKEAVIQTACDRLRAVLLTSLTTIAGLTPLLFEKSTQAQFLIPMATSITFGLAFATFLILIFIPTMISLINKD